MNKVGAIKPLLLRSNKLVLFLKEVKLELARVTWPSKQETVKLTGLVIAVSLVVGLFIGLLDFLFTNLMTLIIKK